MRLRCPVLRDPLEEVDLRVEEERKPRREVVHVDPASDGLLHVGQPILERERELRAAVEPASRMW